MSPLTSFGRHDRFGVWKAVFYPQPCHSDRAVRRVEESCRGFFVSNWLCSKPGKSLCDRIHLTFATASRCLHSLRSVDMTAFASGNSCFISSRVQKLQNSAKPNSGTVRRFPVLPTPCAKTQEFCKAEFLDSMSVLALELSTLFPNSAPLNSGLWLTAFGKSGLFRCQSTFATRFC